MINIINGNILDCKEDIICHQVNVQGIMGGGVARQLADRYEGLEKEYSRVCKEADNSFDDLSATIFWFKTAEKYIANMFSQEPNFNTNYYCLKECLKTVKEDAKATNKSVAIPYGIRL
jgi:O-acetyl-ADP-ribose deacetylase (regulator of RNase III)